MVDFGSEVSFANAAKKVKIHYGADVASSTTRLDVEKHAKRIRLMDEENKFESIQAEADGIIGEIDGSLVPIVSKKDVTNLSIDQRKNKTFEWKEARLALARAVGKVDPVYAATIGSIDEAGDKLAIAVKRAGEGKKTNIHCVGDGAVWIAEQVERIFGDRAKFLLDFYHVSEYLSQAAVCCQPDAPQAWLHEQQALLKDGKISAVIKALNEHNFEECSSKGICGALKCLNYLSRRLHQLHYKEALDAGLPIGSGEIESGHRSVIQKRLKLPGAWWAIENAKDMIALRVLCANDQISQYWSDTMNERGGFVYG
jgi:hypothetical protein